MYKFLGWSVGTLALLASSAGAQQFQRRATLVGGGGPNSGKCTVEVVVDGAAEVQISGDTATLRNVWGQPPQWRRFECTGPMPANPADFRFEGVDGRGRQELIRDPRQGGSAVVHIEDKDGGSEGYTFDITWGGGGGYPQASRNAPYPQPGPPPVYGGQGPGGRLPVNEAIRACREDIRGRAAERFGTNINFQDMRMEDNPDRRDWVLGTFTTPRDRGRLHQFACSVNFDNGNVRWAQIDPPGGRWDYRNDRDERGGGRRDAVGNCQRAVSDRMRDRGYRDLDFARIQVDDNPGRNDWVVGSVRGDRGGRPDRFEFSCRVDLRDGDVRSVDLNRR